MQDYITTEFNFLLQSVLNNAAAREEAASSTFGTVPFSGQGLAVVGNYSITPDEADYLVTLVMNYVGTSAS
tara:strand:- start:892 stop:1104 length:213 start_codon:yes stop_codon:yes gene_type:complete